MRELEKAMTAAVLAALLLFGVAVRSWAGSSDATPEQQCAAAKMRAIGRSVQLRVRCMARGSVESDFDADACVARAQATMVHSFAKAENGTCDTVGDFDDWDTVAQDYADSIETDLAP